MTASPIQTLYGTATAVTITLAGLASAAGRASTFINFGTMSPVPLDAAVMVTIKSGATVVAPSSLTVYAYGGLTGAAPFTDGVTGSDAAFTPSASTNLKPLGIINAGTAAASYTGGPWDLSAPFGGFLPINAGIVVVNNTGGTLDATGTNFSAMLLTNILNVGT